MTHWLRSPEQAAWGRPVPLPPPTDRLDEADAGIAAVEPYARPASENVAVLAEALRLAVVDLRELRAKIARLEATEARGAR
jgi:hypothetical protein